MAPATSTSSNVSQPVRRINRLIFWLLPLVAILLNGVSGWLSLSEWVNVKILGRTNGYPFGGEGPTPYYYKSADLYAAVNLIWGLIFLATFAFGIVAITQRNRKIALITTLLTLLLWLLHYLQAGY